MKRRFAGLKARDYVFRNSDGSSRQVIAILAGGKRIAFLEYDDTAYDFINKIHDLCEEHENNEREAP